MRYAIVMLGVVACGDDHPAKIDAPTDAVAIDAVDPMPIKSVVVIVKENHTFDDYFQGFPGAETSTTAKLSDGSTITRQPFANGKYPCDLPHDNDAAVTSYRNAGMDGFDLVSYSCKATDPVLPFRFHTEAQIPNYWAYARNFVLADHYHSTLKGGTTAGHLATVAAETPFFGNSASGDGCSATPIPTLDTAYNRQTCTIRQPVEACFDIPSVVDHFTGSWLSYGPGTTDITTPFNFIKSIGGNAATRDAHYRPLSTLLADLEAGRQADLVYAHVYGGKYTGMPGEDDNSEHPPADPCWGENYTVMLVNAIMRGPRWKETAILVTYDDYGGHYDHVAPKREACEQFNPGFRLPMTIISPYAKHGFVLHKDEQGLAQEQASIAKLIEDVFGLPRMQSEYEFARDGQAGSLMGAFDFTQPPRDPMILDVRACQ